MSTLLDRRGNKVARGDRLVDAHGGVWSVLFIGMDGKAHCMSPGGRRVQVEAARFIKISAHHRATLPTVGERRKWFFRKMEWE